ncbi:Uncharacterised protein [uncultured archaeon]|nr:Uncharacterised protein [uncultured archaeon]
MSASAHSMWVESRDVANVGDSQDIYTFYGHMNDPTGMNVPLLDETYLLTPDGQKLNLKIDKGNWLPAYGWMEYGRSNATFYWPGNYVYIAARSPSVYDPAWGEGGASNPRLGYSFAKVLIHVGNETNAIVNTSLPLDLTPEKASYDIHIKDNVTFSVLYQGKQVNATYSAFPVTSSQKVQSGATKDKDSFVINFNQGGLWQVSAIYDIAGKGEWTATYDQSSGHFKTGEKVPYIVTRYSTVMSIWVRK